MKKKIIKDSNRGKSQNKNPYLGKLSTKIHTVENPRTKNPNRGKPENKKGQNKKSLP